MYSLPLPATAQQDATNAGSARRRVGIYAWALSGFLKLSSPGEAIGVGLMWMILTIIFEFALGRYVVGDSWSKLLANYNIFEGRVFGLFILWVGLAP